LFCSAFLSLSFSLVSTWSAEFILISTIVIDHSKSKNIIIHQSSDVSSRVTRSRDKVRFDMKE
jgi:hypothetical protein